MARTINPLCLVPNRWNPSSNKIQRNSRRRSVLPWRYGCLFKCPLRSNQSTWTGTTGSSGLCSRQVSGRDLLHRWWESKCERKNYVYFIRGHLTFAGNYYGLRGQHEKAVLYLQRALKLNPHYSYGITIVYVNFLKVKFIIMQHGQLWAMKTLRWRTQTLLLRATERLQVEILLTDFNLGITDDVYLLIVC